MTKRIRAIAASTVFSVVVSACGSSSLALDAAPAPLSAQPQSPGTLLYVAGAPSHGLGVDNTDLIAAAPNGRALDLTSSDAAESKAVWSADGTYVVFERESTTGHDNGAIAFQHGIYTWSPGQGAPTQIASCPTGGSCDQSELAWSPDDRQIAFLSGSGYGAAIEVMNADGSGVHTICDVKRCGINLDAPLWSPDGSKLVFSNQGASYFSQVVVTHAAVGATGGTGATGAAGPWVPISNIWVANADGSGLEQLTQPGCKAGQRASARCGSYTAPAWSPNGKLIAFRRHAHVEVMDADGSHIRNIADCHGCGSDPRPVWAPDGKAIAYAADNSIRITTLHGKTTTLRTCRESCVAPTQLTWSPSGDQLAFFDGSSPKVATVWAIGRDGEGMHSIATEADTCCLAWVPDVSLRGTKPIPKLPPAGHFHLSGTLAYSNPDGTLGFLSLNPNGERPGKDEWIAGLSPAWSPDGRQLAYAGGLGGETGSNIYVSDPNGEHTRVLTHFENGASAPEWSPDGRTIAFNGSDRSYPEAIWLVPAAGGPVRRLITTDGIYESWSPEGSELLFPRNGALFTIHPDGTGLRRLTNLPGTQDWAAWSPDGKEIAFDWRTPSGTSGEYLIHPDGTHLSRLTTTPGVGGGAWSPDGRYLAGTDLTGDSSQWPLVVIDVKTGRYSTVSSLPQNAADLSWSSN